MPLTSLARRPRRVRTRLPFARARQAAPALPLACALCVVSAPSHAQSGTEAQTLPGVTVTGRALDESRRSPNLATGVAGTDLETPFSTTIVPATRVREQGGTTLQDALRNVPGAQADSGFNGSHTQFFILRGAVTDSGTGSNRVLRDGVRLSNYPYVPAFVESVEVLRGPGSAIGVRSEPGGTVNLSTRRPRMADFGSVYGALGRHGEHELSVDLNRVLSKEDEWAARLIATRSAASEWRHVADRLDGIKLGVAKGGGERYHLSAGVEVTNQRYEPDYGIPSLAGRPVDVPRSRQLGEPFGDSTIRNRIADLHGDVALDAETRLAIDYTHLYARSTSIRNLLFGAPLANQPPGTWARISSWEADTTRHIDSVSTSLTSLRTSGAFAHRLFFAIDYYKEKLNQPTLSVPGSTSPSINVFLPVYGRVTAPPEGAALPVSLTTEDLEAVGASLQDKVDVGTWSVVAGARFDHQHFRYGSQAVAAVHESRWSPKLAVLKRLGESDTLYAHLSSGTSPNQVSSATNRSLPSRHARQAELGWKSLWLDGRLTSDLAVYRLEQKNMISADQSTPTNNFDFTVGGAARSQGLEFALTGDVGQRLSIAATYAYTDADYRENAVYGFNRVPNVARHTASLWAQRLWEGGWRTGAVLYGQSRRFADEANTTVLPGYARLDLVQAWSGALGAGRSIELQLALRNVFDKHYYVSSHLHVSRWVTPAQGRNGLVSATYRF